MTSEGHDAARSRAHHPLSSSYLINVLINIIIDTIINIVAPLNARKSADVADQLSATIGNSQRDARGLKFGRKSGAVAGTTRVWR